MWPRKRKTPLTSKEVGVKYGFRSGLEEATAEQLKRLGVAFTFEKLVLTYKKPMTTHKYTPDFVITTRSGKQIVVETKGRFLTADRQKMILVKAAHPELDIRFVFSRSATPISKKSKTTYAMWCDRYGFQYADKEVPEAWLNE
jgi:hypothetical protein